MAEVSEYVVQRVDEDTFELWLDGNLLETLTKEEAWPVMLGRIHPEVVVREKHAEKQQQDSNKPESDT